MTTVTLWYTVGKNCVDIVKPSLEIMSAYESIKDILILHTYSNSKLGNELTSICPEKITEYWKYFGDGYEKSLDQGGYDQVEARNYILHIAENTQNEWLAHLDADEFFTSLVFEELRSASFDKKLLTCSCYNFYSLYEAEIKSHKEHYVNGKYLLNPRDRIWRRGLKKKHISFNALPGYIKNKSRHCGVDFSDISKSEVIIVEGISLVHTHHLLEKSGWDNKVETIRCDDFEFSQAYLYLFEKYGNLRLKNEIKNLRKDYKFVTRVYLINHEYRKIVYVPLRGLAFYSTGIMEELVRKINDGLDLTIEEKRSEEFKTLFDCNLLTKTEYTEKYPILTKIKNHYPLQATILFTENCNLECSYCYSESKDLSDERERIDKKFIEKSINVIVESANHRKAKSVDLRYLGGGEPTLEWDLLKYTTCYAKSLCQSKTLKLWIRLITNGTLLNENKVKWLSENIDYITLSFDILPFLQQERNFANGKNTYKKLLNVISLIDEYKIPYCFRSTVTSNSVVHLEEMVRHAAEISKVKTIRLEPLSNVGSSVKNHIQTPDPGLFYNNFFRARSMGRTLGIDVKCKMSEIIDLCVARYCDAEFTITPKGIVTACHRYSTPSSDSFDSFKYGNFQDGKIVLNVEKLNKILSVTGKSFAECQNCFALWNCSGGCLSARTFNNNIDSHSPHCALTKLVLKGMIQERLSYHL